MRGAENERGRGRKRESIVCGGGGITNKVYFECVYEKLMVCRINRVALNFTSATNDSIHDLKSACYVATKMSKTFS